MLRAMRRPGTAGSTGEDRGIATDSRTDAVEEPVADDATVSTGANLVDAAETAEVDDAIEPSVPAPVSPSIPAPGAAPASPIRPPIPARPWQPSRQGSRDRPPVREQPEVDPNADSAAPGIERVATAPQLRRFIKSRAYVPMHELRRRFAINGGDDDVTQVALERTHIYVGLPEREGQLLGELLRGGDIGYELSLDPITPIVVGVYPMRPVTRG